ncbi:MAG: sn-glycerol-3-phosphate ABC transporter ATP-binding protein UgpC [Nitratireductor sp.]
MATVTLKGVRKKYGRVEVIPPIDLEVPSGEFIALVGPSGSGKSTLLRIIAGLEEIDAGRIFVDGKDVTQTEPSDRDMAMVFQSYALYPHMTVAENMVFALRMRGTDPTEIARRLEAALKMLGMSEYANRRPGQLSGGQRQRVAMGRAIVRQPQVFLFDEPLSNLDAKLRAATRLELRALHDQLGATSVFVTHDQIEAMTMADRIVLLDGGRVQQIGTPREIYREPQNRFVASFIGSPEINMLRGMLASAAGRLTFEGLPLSESLQAAAGREVDLGIRPEHIRVWPDAAPDRWPFEVDAVEFTGHDAFLVGKTPAGRVTLRIDPDNDRGLADSVVAGQQLHVQLQERHILLFNPDTGVRITNG